jgi:hypothetical protein
MFAIVKDNTVQQIIQEGSQFTVDGVTYANNWFQLATQEEKNALGVMEVVYGARPNDKYYWVTESAPAINGNVVDIGFTSTPKDLARLKTTAIDQVNQQAFSLLSPTDYMSIKALETGTAIADNWKTWRESIRTSALNAKTAITASTDVDSLITASTVNWPNDPNYVAPTTPTPDTPTP